MYYKENTLSVFRPVRHHLQLFLFMGLGSTLSCYTPYLSCSAPFSCVPSPIDPTIPLTPHWILPYPLTSTTNTLHPAQPPSQHIPTSPNTLLSPSHSTVPYSCSSEHTNLTAAVPRGPGILLRIIFLAPNPFMSHFTLTACKGLDIEPRLSTGHQATDYYPLCPVLQPVFYPS